MMTMPSTRHTLCTFLLTVILSTLAVPFTVSAADVLENRIPIPLVVDPVPNYKSVLPAVRLDSIEGLESLTSSITINYLPAGADPYGIGDTCTTWPAEAKSAFESAVNIWTSRLVSAVPIIIDACWATNFTGGVLGHSASLGSLRNFTNAPVANTWYPYTLANALAGSKISTGSDIFIAYNSTYSWYYGTDGLPPATQIDFVSVVAHEIAHGLGFSGSMTVSAGAGSWGSGSGNPKAYDRFNVDGSGQSLINTAIYPNPSTTLGTTLQSDNVWFAGAKAKSANGGINVKLYAPSPWAPGSSYSHLDYYTYSSTTNALMVYAISKGRAIHDPGVVTMGLLKDLGWTTSDMLVNGVCGSSHNAVFATPPVSNLCSLGTASALSGSGPWSWTCSGLNGGATASCHTSVARVDGVCGSSHTKVFATAPASGLCSLGTASSLNGSGPWSWTCIGMNGGTTSSCSTGVSIALNDFSSCTLPVGWTVVDNAATGAVWTFNDPGTRTNKTDGSGCFAIADSDKAGMINMDTGLISPSYDLSFYSSVVIGFKTYYYFYDGGDVLDVDVSVDGGSAWSNVWKKSWATYTGTEYIDISSLAAGRPNTKVRFHYYGANYDWYWQVDDFIINGVSAPKAKIGSTGYSSLKAAYTAAVSSDVIRILGGELPDPGLDINDTLAHGKTVYLMGGYDADYVDRSGLPNTYLKGPLKISSGRFYVDGLTVR